MELIQGIIQPPRVQSVEETIPTLCDRLENSTLISDRRSAVLGLKSFSREYRETVIASGLKTLINTLVTDQEDHDLVRALLETLLILFIRGEGKDDLTRNWISQQSRLQNGKYPSPIVMKEENENVDQFSLWITDALTQTDEIVKLLFTFLDSAAFHIKLYTIQLLEALISTRPLRTREVILHIPTGVSTLVNLLNDINEPVRDETILLLMAVVNDNSHFQKLVAFENVFEKLFSIIDDEGGLRGSLVVNDCLSLVNNILKYNTSNQTLFFETGNLRNLTALLSEPLSIEEEFFWNEQRTTNTKTVLDIIKLTVEDGNTVTPAHQDILYEAQALMIVLRLAFFILTPNSIRLCSLLTAAEMIRKNNKIQDKFSQIDVPYWDPSIPSNSSTSEPRTLPVVNLLLSWMLLMNSVHIFDIRVASLELLKAYFINNKEKKTSFLKSQVDQFNESFETVSSEDGEANILQPIFNYDPDLNLNPYKLFFSTDLLMFFIKTDDVEGTTRSLISSLSSGNEEEDEESMVAVQTVGELLIANLTSQDIRIPIAFVSFLIFWLYEDPATVDEFLRNKSLINNFISFSLQIEHQDTCIRCLTTMLLGVAYEFSSASSPFSRGDFHNLLTSRISPDNYSSRIRQLKENELFAGSQEIYLNPSFDETGLPNIFFSTHFSELVYDNFYRIQSSLRRGPENQPDAKITFEIYDKLCSDLNKTETALLRSSTEKENIIESLKSNLADVTKSLEKVEAEREKAEREFKETNEKYLVLQTDLKDAKSALETLNVTSQKLEELKQQNAKSLSTSKDQIEEYREKIDQLQLKITETSSAKQKAEDGINKMSRELFSLTKENSKLKEELDSSSKILESKDKKFSIKTAQLQRRVDEGEKEVAELRERISEDIKAIDSLEKRTTQLSQQKDELENKLSSQSSLIPRLTEKLKSLANNFKRLEGERDDLLEQISTTEETHKAFISNAHLEKKSVEKERDEIKQELERTLENYKKEKKELDDLAHKLESDRNRKTLAITELEKKLAECGSRVTDYANMNKELQETVETMKRKHTELQKSLETTHVASENEKKTIEELHDSVIAINEELQSVILERDELTKENTEIKAKLSSFEQELNEKKQQNRTFKEQISKLTTEVEQISNQSEHKIKTLEALTQEQSATIEDMELKASEVQKEHKTRLENLTFEIKSLSSSIAKLRTVVQTKENLCEETLANARNLQHDKEKLQEIIEQNRNETELSKGTLVEREKRISLLNSELEKSKNLSFSQENELRLKDGEINSLKVEVKEKAQSLNSATVELDELKTLKSTLVLQLDREKERAKNEQKKLHEKLTGIKSELKAKIDSFEKERTLLNEGSSELNQSYSNKISELEDTLNSLKSDNDLKVQKLEELMDEMNQKAEETKIALDEEKLKASMNYQRKVELEKLLESKEIEQDDFKGTVESLKNELGNLELQIQKSKAAQDAQNESSRAYVKQLGENKNVILEMEKTILELSSKLKDAEDKLADTEKMRGELEEMTKSKSTLSNEQAKLMDTFGDLERKHNLKEKETERLKEEMTQKQEALNAAQSSLNEKDQTIVLMENKSESLEKGLKNLNEELKSKADQLSFKEEEYSEIKHKLLLVEESTKQALKLDEERLAKLKDENKSLSEKIAESKKEENSYLEQLNSSEQAWSRQKATLLEQIDSIKEELEKQASVNSELDTKISDLNNENVKLKLSAEDKSEVDELLILLTDLDEQKSKYKRRVLELGGKVSSDEESDEDSE
ncbi:unnamed protein product [Kluyveromyces dobzhanskii CBS 2104]|uniref:WGS project CCBQ000000000 data, contig 00106 n=1 Tax=Kluyveromyces dobzhanskii CBS 2104 TaxID=1427455 RepID=A0A0A8L889_9SACH|nr:unnamed protein product [Kluyveromyces dobzhanskii CBS 2104]